MLAFGKRHAKARGLKPPDVESAIAEARDADQAEESDWRRYRAAAFSSFSLEQQSRLFTNHFFVCHHSVTRLPLQRKRQGIKKGEDYAQQTSA